MDESSKRRVTLVGVADIVTVKLVRRAVVATGALALMLASAQFQGVQAQQCLLCDWRYDDVEEVDEHRFDSQGSLERECWDSFSARAGDDVTCHNSWRDGTCFEHGGCGPDLALLQEKLQRFLANVEPSNDGVLRREVASAIDEHPNIRVVTGEDGITQSIQAVDCTGLVVGEWRVARRGVSEGAASFSLSRVGQDS